MEFLHPAGLYALFLLPLLVVPYLIRRRPERRIFSSLLLLRELTASAAAAPAWRRLRLPPIFFLQLLLLLLLLLALGEPTFSRRAASVALVFDTSASMQARAGEKNRFESAREEAGKILRALPPGARVDLYVAAPALARVTAAPLDARAAAGRVASLRPLDVGEPTVDWGADLGRLARERGYERVYFLTDHPSAGASESVRVISLGQSGGNLAVTDFTVARAALGAVGFAARAEIRSFSAAAEKFNLVLKSGGKVLASRTLTVARNRSVEASFENVPFAPYYEIEAVVDDGLALDNRRFAVPPPAKGFRILSISPRPEALESLRAIPGVELEIVSPEAYEKGNFTAHALEIFHYSAPAALPSANALFILPPSKNPVMRTGPGQPRPTVSGWREPHPLTRYVNFALLRPDYARTLKPGAAGQTIIESPDGALAVVLEQKNLRYLVLGFDPLPFLGRRNLPMSIFTLNALEWFNGAAAAAAATTGAPLQGDFRAGDVVRAPDGRRIAVQENDSAVQANDQGIYQSEQSERGAAKKYFAVNLSDPSESDLRAARPVELRDEPGARAAAPFYSLIWPYLLLAAFALLLLEWSVNRAARMRPPHPTETFQMD